MLQFTVLIALICLIGLSIGLDIVNITGPIKLTDTFTQENYSMIQDIESGTMTYYMNDETKTKYLWYGMYQRINESTIASYIKSDIFTNKFEQYNTINNLPFTVANEHSKFGYGASILVGNVMCTSPTTHDILTCWYNFTEKEFTGPTYNLQCKLYFVNRNTFSDIIYITNDENDINIGSISNIICFNDSYFLPFFHGHWRFNHSFVIYGTLLDLRGNIIYDKISLKNVSFPSGFVEGVFTMKGGQNFNPKLINNKASDLFVLNFGNYSEETNITNVEAIYGYYTNINDTQFPIHIYNDTFISNDSIPTNDIYNTFVLQPIVLDFTSDCCYISIYQQQPNDDSDNQAIFALFTDIHGNNINISQFPNVKDVLLIQNASADVAGMVIDLPMISDTSTHYFMVVYGKEDIYHYWSANETIGAVFYLQKNGSSEYSFGFERDFPLFQIVNATNGQDDDYNFQSVSAYNIPQSNYLCFSWSQDRYYSEIDYMDIYGQTFEIN